MSSDTTPGITAPVPSYGQIYTVAWPLAMKVIMMQGIVIVDAYLVSSLGEVALAAMGLAGALAGLLVGVLVAFSNATQIRIAQAFGATGETGLKTAFYCGLTVNLISTCLGMIFVFLAGPAIITGFAQTPWIAEQAIAYLNVFTLLILFEATAQAVGSLFNGIGKTRQTFLSYLVAMPVNIAISVVLIYGLGPAPELGVVGAAWGSAAGALARLIYIGAFFLRDTGAYRHVTGWTRDSFGAAFKRHMIFSWPIAGTFVSVTLASQACVLIYAKMSINDFAAITLVLPWVMVAGTFGMAWAQATGILAAQLLGAHETESRLDTFIGRAFRGAFVAAGIVSFAYLVFIVLSDRLYDALQPETRAALWTFLPVLMVLPFPKGSNAICGQTLRAAGDTVHVMNIFISAQWLFKVPLTLLFVVTLDLSVTWVFALVLCEELFKFPLFHRRLFTGQWKQARDLDV